MRRVHAICGRPKTKGSRRNTLILQDQLTIIRNNCTIFLQNQRFSDTLMYFSHLPAPTIGTSIFQQHLARTDTLSGIQQMKENYLRLGHKIFYKNQLINTTLTVGVQVQTTTKNIDVPFTKTVKENLFKQFSQRRRKKLCFVKIFITNKEFSNKEHVL